MPAQRQCSKIVLLLLSQVMLSRAMYFYDYAKYGADWPDIDEDFNMCGGDYQSPIDLKYSFGNVTYGEDDKLFKHYENIEATSIEWKKGTFTAAIKLPKMQPITDFSDNYFTSKYFNNALAKDKKVHSFKANYVHFNAKSQHTIEGQRFGFEMETMYVLDGSSKGDSAVEGYHGAATSILFDPYDHSEEVTKEEVAIIDAFFDSLQMDVLLEKELNWNSASGVNPKVDITSVPFGELMNMVSSSQRWVYTGSLTTPYCTEKVYWNVIEKVYPIKQKHLSAFKALLRAEMVAQPGKLKANGNYRLTQEIKKQAPKLMVPPPPPVVEEDPDHGLKAASVVFVVFFMCCFINGGISWVYFQNKKDQQEKEFQVKLYEKEPKAVEYATKKQRQLPVSDDAVTPDQVKVQIQEQTLPDAKPEVYQPILSQQESVRKDVPKTKVDDLEFNGQTVATPKNVESTRPLMVEQTNTKYMELPSANDMTSKATPAQPEYVKLNQESLDVSITQQQKPFVPEQSLDVSINQQQKPSGQEQSLDVSITQPLRTPNPVQNMVMMSSANFGSENEQQRNNGFTALEETFRKMLADKSPSQAIRKATTDRSDR